MSLPIGTRLGPYEIVAPLGAGAMGEVYRALDPRLGREVALKVLPAEFARDPDRVARFERESRSASSLADAHIVTVFDVGVDDGVHFFASELVTGPSLRQLLLDGPPPLRRALEIAAQVAQGLAAAHARGIVHRDLKPDNVLIAAGGTAKIADFGLAKGLHGDWGAQPYVSAPGILLGTVTYMSPEQAMGKTLDARSDQFAFGSMFYELLTGHAPFRRESVTDSLTAILRDEADLEPIRSRNVPPSVVWILERCLSKDPDGRYASTKDLALELQHLLHHTTQMRAPSSGADGPIRPTATTSRVASTAAWALLCGLALGGLATWLAGRLRSAPVTAPSVRFLVPPPSLHGFSASLDNVNFAVSPDGRTLAFIATDDSESANAIFLRTLDDPEPQLVAGSEGARSLFWSPDGHALGFAAGGAVFAVEPGGKAAVRICDIPAGSGFAGTWGSEGNIAYVLTGGEAIYRVSALGGEPAPWHSRDAASDEVRLGWPQLLREGGLLYTVRGSKGDSWLALLAEGQAPRRLGAISSRFELLDARTLVFARDGALVEQRFDPASGLLGAPKLLAPRVRSFRSNLWAGFAASRGGTLIWQTAEDDDELRWFGRDGSRGEAIGRGSILEASISPDGAQVISARKRPELGTFDLWSFDIRRGTESRLTSDPDTEFAGLLLPDRRTLFYSAVSGPLPRIVQRDLQTGTEQFLLEPVGFQMAQSTTRDGRLLAFSRSGEHGFELFTLVLDGRSAPVPFQRGFNAEEIRLSPDGRYAVFISNQSGSDQAYVASLAAPAERVAISAHGARSVFWRADGAEILYLSGDQQVMSVPVATTGRLEVGAPRPLFAIPAGARWITMTATPDGQRLLGNVRLSAARSQPLTALLGHQSAP